MITKEMRRTLFLILVCIVLPVVVFFIVIWQYPVDPSKYHFNALLEADRNFLSSTDEQDSGHFWEAVLEHRQALVELGALKEIVLPLRQISASSNEFLELSKILHNTAEGPFAHFEWEDGNNLTPIGVRIWYKPESNELARWESDLSPYSPNP